MNEHDSKRREIGSGCYTRQRKRKCSSIFKYVQLGMGAKIVELPSGYD